MQSVENQFPTHFVDETTVLPNGVTVVTRAVDPVFYHKNRCAFSVDIKAGAQNAPSGYTHFLEHCVLQPAYNKSPHEKAFEAFAVERHYSGIISQAMTSVSRTKFALSPFWGNTVFIEDLEAMLRMQLRVPLTPDFTVSHFEFQRERIAPEWSGQTAKDIRNWQFLDARIGNIMPYSTLGSEDEIRAINREQIIALYETLYVGSNFIVPITFPANNDRGITHEALVEIVDQELRILPRGHAAMAIPAVKFYDRDLRLDGSLLSSQDDATIKISFLGTSRFTESSHAQNAFNEIFGKKILKAIGNAGGIYYFHHPKVDWTDFSPGIDMEFTAPIGKVRPAFEIIENTIKDLAQCDLTYNLDQYKQSQAKASQRQYRHTEDAFERLNTGLAYIGEPAHPDEAFIGAAALCTDKVLQYARSMVHSPIGICVEYARDGDLQGRYVPFVAEFAQQLRLSVPKPIEAKVDGRLDLLPRKNLGNQAKLKL